MGPQAPVDYLEKDYLLYASYMLLEPPYFIKMSLLALLAAAAALKSPPSMVILTLHGEKVQNRTRLKILLQDFF